MVPPSAPPGLGRAPIHRGTLPLVLLLLAACASGTTRSDPFEASGRQSNEIEILVRNDNFNQVTVYTSRSPGSSQRLGIVAGKSDARFRIEWFLPDIQLRVKFLAGSDFLTDRIPVSPGETLELIIPIRE